MTRRGFARSRLFSNRDFLKLWAAQAGSAIGSRISRTALPVIAVLSLSAGTQQVSILSAVTVLPAVLVGMLFSGAIERARKQRVMIAADLLRALLLVIIPIAAWGGWLNIWLLDAIAFFQGAATSAFRIADASFLPAVLDEGLLVDGNAKFESTDAVAEAAGPGLAGVLIQLLSAPVAVLIDALSYLWSALWLTRLADVRHQASFDPVRPSLRTDILVGFRASSSTPLLRATLAIEILTSISNGFFMALYMVLALREMALSPAAVGLIIGVGGLSSLAAALAAPQLARRMALLPLLITSLIIGQGADFFIVLAPSAGRLGPTFLIAQQFLGDGFCTLYAIYAVSARQRLLDLNVQARSNATFQIVSGFALPLGALIAGEMAKHVGIQISMLVAGLLGVVSAATLLPAIATPEDDLKMTGH
jgi:Na+/melibiose symporter-like transporter